jgi:hypothetical protein
MSKVFHALVVVLVLVGAAAVHADPNMPRSATKYSTDLVRAYNQCSGPNSNTTIRNSTIEACGPVQPMSDYTFGPAGYGRAEVLLAGPQQGGFLVFHVTLRDVRDAAGNKVDKAAFYLAYDYRVSTDLCQSEMDCTVVDLPNGYPSVPSASDASASSSCNNSGLSIPCKKGQCSVSFGDTFQTGAILMAPVRANIEITDLKVLDPDCNVFAVPGIGRSYGQP